MKPQERDERLLRVPVVALAFRPGLEAEETFDTALAIDPRARCWALLSNEDVPSMRQSWSQADESALLIVHTNRESALAIACELLRALPDGPSALLLANLPPKKGLFPSMRHSQEALKLLEASHPDLQVHVHSAEWLRRPPRIR